MESLLPVIIQLISGAVGGNIAGALLKKLSLGPVGNSLVGILGGGVGGQLLSALGASVGGAGGIGNILGDIGSGGVGGAVLLAVVGLLKKMFAK
jgi:uncharacterized membrane protein YeaQ/YmgE (transglycosylase-associated protein family)